jgi:anti-sigma B factor antagonist
LEHIVFEDGEWVVLQLKGALNFECTDQLKTVFDDLLEKKYSAVRLDLREVPVSNSSGIGCILMFYKNLKKKGGKLVIKGISKNLAEMFRLIKIDQVIPIEED